MGLNKKTMVREIGRRTQIKNRDVQAVIETLMQLWTEELTSGGRIELEGFCTLQVHYLERLHPRTKQLCSFPRLHLRVGNQLRIRLKAPDMKTSF